MLSELLAVAGLDRTNVYICNTVCCRPCDSARGPNRAPEPHEVEACRGFLEGQLRALRPRLVVALGRVAASELLGRDVSVEREHGTVHDVEYGEISKSKFRLFVTFHPAAGIYERARLDEMRADFRALGDLLAEVGVVERRVDVTRAGEGVYEFRPE